MNFDLRCNVREKMTAWIQQNYPDAFPRTRFAALSTASPSSNPDSSNPGLQPNGTHGQSTAMHSDGQASGR
jgi:hypothetical protein